MYLQLLILLKWVIIIMETFIWTWAYVTVLHYSRLCLWTIESRTMMSSSFMYMYMQCPETPTFCYCVCVHELYYHASTQSHQATSSFYSNFWNRSLSKKLNHMVIFCYRRICWLLCMLILVLLVIWNIVYQLRELNDQRQYLYYDS